MNKKLPIDRVTLVNLVYGNIVFLIFQQCWMFRSLIWFRANVSHYVSTGNNRDRVIGCYIGYILVTSSRQTHLWCFPMRVLQTKRHRRRILSFLFRPTYKTSFIKRIKSSSVISDYSYVSLNVKFFMIHFVLCRMVSEWFQRTAIKLKVNRFSTIRLSQYGRERERGPQGSQVSSL